VLRGILLQPEDAGQSEEEFTNLCQMRARPEDGWEEASYLGLTA